jgi:DNA polymerase-1
MRLTCTECSLSKIGCFSGEGSLTADIIIVSDRLSSEAFNAGAAFSDRVGKQIDTYLMTAGIDKTKVYITNTVKGVVKPKMTVGIVPIRKCSPLLVSEIKNINPKVIVLMGATAYKNFHGKAVSGTSYYDDDYKAWVIYTHHTLKPLITGNEGDFQQILDSFTLAKELITKEKGVTLVEPPIKIITTLPELLEFAITVKEDEEMGVDCETSGLIVFKEKLLTIGYANNRIAVGVVVTPEMIPTIQQISDSIRHIGHHVKFDMQFLRHSGIIVKKPYFDTMLAHYVLDPLATSHDLSSLGLRFLQTNFNKSIDYPTLFKDGITQDILNLLAKRGAQDAFLSFKLKEIFQPGIDKDYKKFFNTVIMPINNVLAEMEYNGVTIDKDELYATEKMLEYQLKSAESSLLLEPIMSKFMAGEGLTVINLNSPKQMSSLLYKYLRMPVDKEKGKTTDKNILEKINVSFDNPIVSKLLAYRNLAKLKDTYIKGIKEALDRSDNERIHVSYHQTVAITGRLSASKPNLQTIPKSVDNSVVIRKMFIAKKDYTLVEMDFKQLEFRVWAHLSKDANMIDMIAQGGDIHKRMASWINKVPEDKITDEERQQAKEISFGLIYGMGVKTLAERCKISFEEAQRIKEGFFSLFPDATIWIQQVADFGTKHNYVTTPFGRKIPILYNPNDQEAVASARRQAVNYPVQSTAAELTNLTGVYLKEIIDMAKYDATLLLNVHDSLIWEVRDELVDKFKPYALQGIQKVSDLLQFKAYLAASFKKGKNLGEQTEL